MKASVWVAFKVSIAVCVAVFVFVSMKIVNGVNSMLGFGQNNSEITKSGAQIAHADTPYAQPYYQGYYQPYYEGYYQGYYQGTYYAQGYYEGTYYAESVYTPVGEGCGASCEASGSSC